MAKSGKKSKGLIPKKIAGVKVPKRVRKGRFGELLASKSGQALIAQAILGVGAVAAGVKAKGDPKARRFAADAKHGLADAGREATGSVADAGSTLSYALAEAARTFAEALRRGEGRTFAPSDDAETAWTPDYGAPEEPRASGRKKQPSAYDPGPG
jgi:hypothetical protein